MSLRKAATAALAGLALLGFAGAANALEFRNYTPEEFSALQAAGVPFVVDVHATWCPTCQAQRAVILELAEDPRFDGIPILVIDYDSERQYMRMRGVTQRSTLIAFNGGAEVTRLYAVTSFEGIQDLFLSIAPPSTEPPKKAWWVV